MREVLAFVRRDLLVASSYRLQSLLSLGSLLTLVIPLYFVARAIQPVVGGAIASEGGHYFAFLIAGMATYQFAMTAVNALPTAVASGIRTGTFEALLATPLRLPVLLGGLVAYPLLWALLRAVVLILAGRVLGAEFALERLGFALVIWGAITLAYIPFGLLASALLLVTRSAGALPNVVLTASMLLGGVYYPTNVIPSWLRAVSDVVPLGYGLRALRRVLAPDVAYTAVATDLAALGAFAVAWLLVAGVAVHFALAHARRRGTLAQY